MTTSRMGPMIVGLGLVIAGALFILTYYYQKAGGRLPLAGERYTFKIRVDEPQQLLKHADVRAAGVPVGEVNSIENETDPKTGQTLAVVELAIDEDKLEPVYRDAKFLVRQKTLVGENYVQVIQGSKTNDPIKEGEDLPLKPNTQEVVPLDRLLGMLDAKTRANVSKNFQTLGAGFDGRAKEFGQVLQSLQPLFNDGGRTIGILEDQKETVAEAIQATGIVTQAIADRGQDMQTLIRAAKRTSESVERRDGELKEFFAELPSTLAQARSTVTNLSGFSNRAVPTVASLRTGLTALKSPVQDLGPTATTTRTLFRELTPTLKVLEPVVDQLKPFAEAGGGAVPSLDALMRQTNPFLRYIKPYDRDIGGLLANFSAGHQEKTFFGQLAHCSCPISDDTISAFLPQEDAQDFIRALTEVGFVQDNILKRTVNNIRKPGQLPDQSIPEGPYPRVEADGPDGPSAPVNQP